MKFEKKISSQIACIYVSYKEFIYNNGYCNQYCPVECEYSTYKKIISLSDYPSKAYYRNVLSNNEVIKKNLNEGGLSYESVEQNTLSVRIYFEDLTYELTSESPKILFVDMFANLGGLLGLFLGMNNFILFEISLIF